MAEFNVLADGLRFPEGPVAMPDGSVILVEIARGALCHKFPAFQPAARGLWQGAGRRQWAAPCIDAPSKR